jgi:hypothetical protein
MVYQRGATGVLFDAMLEVSNSTANHVLTNALDHLKGLTPPVPSISDEGEVLSFDCKVG